MGINRLHIASLIWAALWGAFSLSAPTPFQQLKAKFENGSVLQADFTQRTVDSYTGNKSRRSGELWVAKNAYKVVSGKQKITVNGSTSTVYDLSKDRVIISDYSPEDDDFAPSRFLNGVDSTYSIVKQGKTGGHYFIELHSDDPFSVFKKVMITLGKHSVPIKLKVVDTADNQITTTFSNGRFISRKPDIFHLTYPDSVQLIDMRK